MKQFIVKLEAHLALVYSLARLRADSIWTLFLHHLLPQNETFHSICDCSIFKKNEIRLLLLPHFFCFFCMRSAPRAKWVKFRFFLYFICSIEHWLLDCCKLWRSIAVHARISTYSQFNSNLMRSFQFVQIK